MQEKSNNSRNVPNLRFPGFSGEWETKFLSDLMTFKNGINASKDDYGYGYKFINVLDIINNDFIDHNNITGSVNISENDYRKNIVEYGDILFQRSSETREDVGQANVYIDNDKTATFGGFVIRGKKNANYNPIYLNYLLKTSYARKEITSKSGGSTRYNVGQNTLSSVKIMLATLPEQNKIASLLIKIDQRISTQSQIINQLESLKKGLCKKIFSQEIRFKDENGNYFFKWNKTLLREIAHRITTKNDENNQNVLTISAQQGLISQNDFFHKSVSSKNLKGYYLLHKNEFAYNKSYSIGYPMGAIKRLKYYEKGIVSTLYICFQLKKGIDISFIEQYFESGNHIAELQKIAQEGARNHGLLNIALEDFFSIKLKIPEHQEQSKIANFLSSIDKKIETEKQLLKQYEKQKKYLLQNLFI